MSLWRVDITGVSSRYVEAPSAAEARQAVREMIAAALDVRASPATQIVQSTYDRSGPIQQRRLLESLDSLAPPQAAKRARTARRQLARQVKYNLERQEALKRLNAAPPVSPETADELVRLTEITRLRSRAVELLLRDSD